MERLGYYNGTYRPLEEMKIPRNDRASWFGDGVYDAGPCHNYHIFALDEHIDRFFRSAAALEIIMPVSKEELKQLLMNLVLKMDTGNLFVYYQVTRGSGIRKHAFTKGTGNLWITLTPAEISDGHKPIQLITTEDTRFLHCNIKTLNLIPSVMAAQKAEASGCDEAVFFPSRRPGYRVRPQQYTYSEKRNLVHSTDRQSDSARHRKGASAAGLLSSGHSLPGRSFQSGGSFRRRRNHRHKLQQSLPARRPN